MTVDVLRQQGPAPCAPEGPDDRRGAGPPRPPRDPVRWLLRAAPLALLGLALAVVLRLSALHLGNDDTWFHLVLGHRFLSGWSLRDPGALTPFATSQWVPTQWSTEMLAAAAEDLAGLPGVAWLFGALYLALVVGSYVSCRRRAGAAAAVLATCLLVLASATVLSARPQAVSMVLLTATVSAWLRTAEDGRPRWWLVPMTWLWATAHGLWSAGVLLGLVCCLGLRLDRRVSGRGLWAMLAVPVLSLVAAALTPVGPRLLLSQLAVSARTGLVAEWGPTSFRSVPALAAAAMLGLLVVLWVRRGQVPWTHVGLLVLASGWALLVSRLVPLAAVVAAPLLAEALGCPPSRTGPVRPAGFVVPRLERAVLAAYALVYLLVLAVAAPQLAKQPADAPSALAGRLQRLPPDSTVLVEDGVGAWLEWRVPDVHPVIDGMLDAYPVRYIRDFDAMTHLDPGWQRFVAASGARTAVVDAGSPLSAALRERLGWRLVRRDGPWLLLTSAPARIDRKPY